MTNVEQQKLIKELRDVEQNMSKDDYEEFVMYRKRNYDDEDLDVQSKKRLQYMYEEYVVNARKVQKENPLDKLFG
ncbi:MAG: hypothetical protein CL946_11900 [Ectothiorhodospiraceae bacterium]|nr:hypothetical protein [Ectothiorhodospiraceae bacterium]